MDRIRKILGKNNVGSMGIGAMIIFIAMVLVAGIAASVLVQVANTLQMQALYTGQETIEEVATGIAVVDIEGHVANATNGVDNITISVRGRAGSGVCNNRHQPRAGGCHWSDHDRYPAAGGHLRVGHA